MDDATANPDDRWQLCIDTGGTFTDCLARAPDGTRRRLKVLSSGALRAAVVAVAGPDRLALALDRDVPAGVLRGFRLRVLPDGPGAVVVAHGADGRVQLDARLAPGLAAGAAVELDSGWDAPVLVARLICGCGPDDTPPPMALRLATTRGTNALLTESGRPPVLFATAGLEDLLWIGDQTRPDLFAQRIERPRALVAAAIGVPGRLAADGHELEALDGAAVEARAAAALADAGGAAGAVVALLHADRNPAHERAVAARLRALGFDPVVCSHEVAAQIGLLARSETAVADAYLMPTIAAYLARIRTALPAAELWVMTSAGGLLPPERFRAKDSLLSGPAGGVLGAARAAAQSGHARAIGFDMGGTSTDVARIDGGPAYDYEHRVGAVRLLAPAVAIHTVAAGGGSRCWLDEDRLAVGPDSAGAAPGPACYGAGGPLALTDVNLLLGRLDATEFRIPVQPAAAAAAVDALLDELRARGLGAARDEVLAGLLAIADERMADAIRAISLRQGHDPSDYALVAFGGAGGQHACSVAARLGIATVLLPADAGLLSAWGLGTATVERFARRQVLRPWADVAAALPGWLDELAAEAEAAVRTAGARGAIEVAQRTAFCRLQGQDATLAVAADAAAALPAAFARAYEAAYGHRPPDRPIELVAVQVLARESAPAVAVPAAPAPRPAPVPAAERPAYVGGAWRSVPVYRRAALAPGHTLDGPALVTEPHATTVVEAGWRLRVDGAGTLVLRAGDVGAAEAPMAAASRPEAVALELFTARLVAIATEMGEQLRRTALSTNVKERLDFSCAVLDGQGRMVTNAPHIPVHLGALGRCVAAVAATLELGPGDIAVTNHPAFGGSHLNDVTVIAPVFDAGGRRLGYVANRAHHAEIGGTRPGSTPPDARTLAEEGVVIAPRYLVRAGVADWDGMAAVLRDGPYPTRALAENLADLQAALAAVQRGRDALAALAAVRGAADVAHGMARLRAAAAARLRARLAARAGERCAARTTLDDGTPLQVAIAIGDGTATIDFAGTGGPHRGNLNATPAIVHSAVLYVLRLLVDEPLPLNDGLFEPVTLRLPPGTIVDPAFGDDPAAAPAVGGGNTELSQRLVEVLLQALGLMAGSQGTMNNLLFGNKEFGYYETIGGGQGAGPGYDGADAIHTHMTNTRLTDVEVLEHRTPVRVRHFGIRRGSGGAGRWRGGDGIVRELEFLAPLDLSLVTQHRHEGPYGLAGGAPGAPGRQVLRRADGRTEELPAVIGVAVEPGDRLTIETPGGGGYGPAAADRAPDPAEA